MDDNDTITIATVTQEGEFGSVTATTQPPQDISPRMVQLARKLDHLANGEDYIIRLTKGDYEWDVTIIKVEGERNYKFWR